MENLMTEFDRILMKSLADALEMWRKEFGVDGKSPLVEMARSRLESLDDNCDNHVLL